MKKFSVVTYIEGEVKKEIRQLQENLFKITGSRECLDSWLPHLTIGNGVEVSANELAEIEESLEHFAASVDMFSVTLEGFGGLTDRVGGEGEETTPYVLWIDVSLSKELHSLVSALKDRLTSKYNQWYQMPQPYSPHVTVAFRDLNKEGYEKGCEYLEQVKFSRVVGMSHVALVENLSGHDDEYRRFSFGRS